MYVAQVVLYVAIIAIAVCVAILGFTHPRKERDDA